MNKRYPAVAAATIASFIYGINHTIAKDIMPAHILPFGFILLRVLGASVLFWAASIFVKNEKIDRKDWPRFLACAVFGMAINMLAFFKGLQLSTPINSSVVITTSPVMLLLLSAVFLKEKIGWVKIVGILMGLVGTLVLILFGESQQENAPSIQLGNLLFVVNASSYAVYLILVKPLTKKYSTVTLMKWLFLIGVVINLPFTIGEFAAVQWSSLSTPVMATMAFVVVGTTFMTYLLNIYALKSLKASTIGAFIYLQPLIAVLFAVITGADRLTLIRIIAAIFIFAGVYLSTRKPKKKQLTG